MQRAIAATQPVTRQIFTGLVVNATGATPTFQLPNDLTEMRLIVQVTAAAGTTPTLDTSLQDSPDNGTTFVYTGNKLAQMIAADMRQISISRERAASQVAAEYSGMPPAAGAAAAAANGPLARLCRLWNVVTGAGATFTINVFIIGTQIV
jgi:hypothetical protein